jgi:hypothetical protein
MSLGKSIEWVRNVGPSDGAPKISEIRLVQRASERIVQLP